MVTPKLTTTEGSVTGVDQKSAGYKIDWSVVDTGMDAKCHFDFSWAKGMDTNLELHFVTKDGESLQKFRSHNKSAKAEFNCVQTLDAKLSLISTSSGWFSQAVEVASVSTNGMNGHSMSVQIAPLAQLIQ